MAMSILYLHKDFSKDAHHGKVFEIGNLGPIFICWRPRGSLRIPRNHKRGGQGLGPWAGPGQGPGTPARPPLLWFLEILRLPLGLQRMNMGPKLPICKTLHVVDERQDYRRKKHTVMDVRDMSTQEAK